ncbi:hypothetical protein [Streptantibioticus ferralitis]|uniref:Uncharacterized protein n=1 Tax=Streptantibioticus ferralitis TaxID=236510 RepID=A0ABT5Z7Q5_9ACTN|nr:hypothetical protein [Streptantibioticus ferralitis]MDF2259667.1 hypothetical protein [Streptantibioticus ferralitis]
MASPRNTERPGDDDMDAMQQLCNEISDLVMDIRVLRAHAQQELYATATAYAPETAPVEPVFVLETDEERVMREEGEQMLADAIEAERDTQWLADREADAAANAHTMSSGEITEQYAAHVERQYLAAEDYCRGVLLNRRAAAAGIDPRTLFSGPSHVAYARASEELLTFWSEVERRLTKTEFTAHLSGRWTQAAQTARHAAWDCAAAA